MTRLTVLGRLTASKDRTLTGLLLPYGEVGSTNLGKVKATPGVVDVPATLDRLAASLEHPAREVGSGECATFSRVWEDAKGLWASWDVAANPAGDRLLAEHAAGTRTGISVELEPIRIDADGNITAGRLDACAFPVRPAFDSARLAAAFAPQVDLDDDREPARLLADYAAESTSTSTDEYDDPETGEHVVVTYVRTSKETATETRDGQPTDDTTDDTTTTDTADTSGDDTLMAGRALAPRTLPRPQGKGPAQGAARLTAESATRVDVLRLMAGAAQGDRRMMAALADITESGTAIHNPAKWLGELWDGQPYERRIVPLMSSDPLTNLRVKGFRWTKRPVMGAWAGDKAQVPSDTVTMEEYEDKAKRLAGAHDIDRAHVDFGDEEFFNAYYKAMAESYARLSDAAALAGLVAGAHDVTLDEVPADIDAGTSMIVDLAVDLVGVGSPTSAVVAVDIYKRMLKTPSDKRLAFLSQSLGLQDGQVDSFKVVPFADMAAGSAIVLVKGGVIFRELGSTPIRADALDIARGGTDRGCYGYYHVQVDERAVAHATLAPAAG